MPFAFRALSFLSIFCLFTACHSARPAATPVEEPDLPASKPEILFLQLKVWKNGAGYGGEIVGRKRVAGQFNRDIRGVQATQGQWLVSFFDRNNNLITRAAVENPLERHYETTDDEGKFRDVLVKKDTAECFVRLQYDPRFSHLQIEQAEAASVLTPIISLKF